MYKYSEVDPRTGWTTTTKRMRTSWVLCADLSGVIRRITSPVLMVRYSIISRSHEDFVMLSRMRIRSKMGIVVILSARMRFASGSSCRIVMRRSSTGGHSATT